MADKELAKLDGNEDLLLPLVDYEKLTGASFSVRSFNALRAKGINITGDVVGLEIAGSTTKSLRRTVLIDGQPTKQAVRRIGIKSIEEIQDILAQRNLAIGMFDGKELGLEPHDDDETVQRKLSERFNIKTVNPPTTKQSGELSRDEFYGIYQRSNSYSDQLPIKCSEEFKAYAQVALRDEELKKQVVVAAFPVVHNALAKGIRENHLDAVLAQDPPVDYKAPAKNKISELEEDKQVLISIGIKKTFAGAIQDVPELGKMANDAGLEVIKPIIQDAVKRDMGME